MNSPFVLGVTGGIGAGKSFVCRLLEARSIPVYYADARGKALLQADPDLKAGLVKLLGEEAVLPSGDVNRPFVAERVFADQRLLNRLNKLVHPAVQADAAAWAAARGAEGHRLVAKEAAILYEAGTYTDCHAVWLVYAPKSLRLLRVMARDAVPEAAVLARMARQWPDAQKRALANYTLYNDGEHALETQLERGLEALLAQRGAQRKIDK